MKKNSFLEIIEFNLDFLNVFSTENKLNECILGFKVLVNNSGPSGALFISGPGFTNVSPILLFEEGTLQHFSLMTNKYPAGIDLAEIQLTDSTDIQNSKNQTFKYSCVRISDDFPALQNSFDPNDRLDYYTIQYKGVNLSKDAVLFGNPDYIVPVVDPPYNTFFRISPLHVLFNGYLFSQIKRNMVNRQELLNPEISVSITNTVSNTSRPFEKITIKTEDDTHIYNSTIYPEDTELGEGIISHTSIIKIKESSSRVVQFQFKQSSIDPTSEIEEKYLKVGLKDNVTTLLNSIQFSSSESLSVYRIGKEINLLSNKSFNHSSSAISYDQVINPNVYDGNTIFDFNYQSSKEFFYSDLSGMYTLPFPFGIINRIEQTPAFLFKVTYFIPQNTKSYSIGSRDGFENVQPLNPNTETQAPQTINLEVIKVDYVTNIYRFHITDNSVGFLYIGHGSKTIYAKDCLVSGTPLDGIYEIIIQNYDVYQNYLTFSLNDWNRNQFLFAGSNVPYYNINSVSPKSKTIDYKLEDITYLDFKYHTMDTSESDAINYLFLNLTADFDRAMTPQFYISYKPVEFSFSPIPFTGYWDSNLQVFVIPFYVPKHFPNTVLEFSLLSIITINQYMLYPIFGQNITVYIQTNPPIISKIEVQEPVSIQGNTLIRLGWIVTIEDEINGFSDGYFEVRSDIDWYTFKLEINDTIRISGDKHLGVYNVTFNVDPAKCVPQNYTIRNVVLNQFDTPEIIYRDPYIKVGYLPFIKAPCDVSSFPLDTKQPSLIAFSGVPQFIDVTSSQRSFRVLFTTMDDESDISEIHVPMIYIHSLITEPIGFRSTLLNSVRLGAYNYQCDIEIPYNYGYGSNISLSIYGIVDNALNLIGYPTYNLSTLFPDQVFIERRVTPNTAKIQLKKQSYITKRGGLLKIEGFGLFNKTNPLIYQVDFGNETISGNDFTIISPFLVGILIPSFKVNQFTVLLKEGPAQSNKLIVFADIHDYKIQTHLPGQPEPTPTPSLTPSPTPTPSPSSTPSPIPCP
eukprot:gene12955-15825_t